MRRFFSLGFAQKGPLVTCGQSKFPLISYTNVSFRVFIHLKDQAEIWPAAGLKIETGKSHKYAHQETI
jgi:hypothetical protein